MPDDRLFIYLSATKDSRKWVFEGNKLPTDFALQVVRSDENFKNIKVLVTRFIKDSDTLTSLIPLIPLFYEENKMIGIRPHQLAFELKCAADPELDGVSNFIETLQYKVSVSHYLDDSSEHRAEFYSPSGSVLFGSLLEDDKFEDSFKLEDAEFERLKSIVQENPSHRLLEIDDSSMWAEPVTKLAIPLWLILDDFLSEDYGFDWGNPRTDFEQKLCNLFRLGDGTGVWAKSPSR
jgi:hypothetical protein